MNFKLKRLLFVAVLSLFVLSGCGSNNLSNTVKKNTGESITIVTSFYPMYVFTLNIVNDIPNVKVVNMTKPITGCLHNYVITTQDMKTLEDSQFFVVNGAGMESFMDKVIKQIPNLKIVEASKGIELIKGEGDTNTNPHVWVGISNAITEVKNIGEQLASLDPDNASKYKANTEVYVKKLEAQKDKMHIEISQLQNRDIITFHEAFPYFAKEFNLNIVGVIEREPGSEPSARELNDSIKKVKTLKVKALFAEPQYSSKAAETIAKETGAKIYTLDPMVTGPVDDANAYIDVMENNLKTLKEALK